MASETVMDILREMREFADTDSQSIGRDVLRRKIQHFIDRLDAAHKREVADALNIGAFVEATRKREVGVAKMETTTGNAAKMREALVNFSNLARAIPVVLNDEMEVKICAALDMSASALAEPPRNCERFNNSSDAWIAWDEEFTHIPQDNDNFVDFGDWLFAKTKGGAE